MHRYLDMQATTPMDPRVLDAMLPFLTEQYGNPHSRTHLFGWESEEAVETARARVSIEARAHIGFHLGRLVCDPGQGFYKGGTPAASSL